MGMSLPHTIVQEIDYFLLYFHENILFSIEAEFKIPSRQIGYIVKER